MYQKKRLMYQVLAAVAAGGLCFGGTAYAAEATGEAAEKAAETAPVDEYALDDIVVTAERIPTKKMDTPAEISVITAKDIEDNHYNDVTEAIKQVPGVSADKFTTFTNVTINGDDRILVLVDGRRMNDSLKMAAGNTTANLSMLPSTKNIERIEVVRGSGSSLYGSDAVGGVINIITKKALENKTIIDMNTGSWGDHKFELTNQGSDGTLSWLVSANLDKRSHAHFKVDGRSVDAKNADRDNNNFVINLRHKIDNSSSLNFDFSHVTQHEGGYFNEVNGSSGDKSMTQIYNNYAVAYNFKEDKETPGVLRIYHNYRSFQYYDPMSTSTSGIDYQNGWKLGKDNTLVFGAEYVRSMTDNSGSGFVGKKISNTAVYLQDTWKFADKWSFVPGVRMDNHNMFGTHWSPKAALNYNANDKTQVFLSWGKVFKAPTADDLYYYLDYGSWGKYMGNPNLKPETGHTTTLGMTHVFDKTSSMSINFFESKLNDAIAWLKVGPDNIATNVSSVKKRGMDISLRKDISKLWSVDATYSYVGIDSYGDSGRYRAMNRNPNEYKFGVHFKQGAWKSNLNARFISGLDNNLFMSQRAAILDFNLSYDFNKQGTVYFKINNLLDKEYSEFPGASGSRYPALGRFFQIGVTYSF